VTANTIVARRDDNHAGYKILKGAERVAAQNSNFGTTTDATNGQEQTAESAMPIVEQVSDVGFWSATSS
jgi:hypothetical protein